MRHNVLRPASFFVASALAFRMSQVQPWVEYSPCSTLAAGSYWGRTTWDIEQARLWRGRNAQARKANTVVEVLWGWSLEGCLAYKGSARNCLHNRYESLCNHFAIRNGELRYVLGMT